MALFHRLLLILIACLAVGLTLAGAPARAAAPMSAARRSNSARVALNDRSAGV